jgi:acyl-CoA thioesterase-1
VNELPGRPAITRVAGVKLLSQADGVHPNTEGVKIIAETVYKALRPLLQKQV